VRAFSSPCGHFSIRAGDLPFRAGQLPVRAAIFPSVRAFFDLCGQKASFLTVFATIPRGFHHSARRWPMKSDYAGSSDKMEINPERVESNWCGRRCNPFRVGKCCGTLTQRSRAPVAPGRRAAGAVFS